MTKPFEFHSVEAEKAEAMRTYNNRRSFRNILRLAAVASVCYLWFPTVAISLQAAGDWILRTGSVMITDRSVVFVFANLIVALIFLFSGESNTESSCSSNTEPDIYDQYTSATSVAIVTVSDEKVVEEDDSNKQTVIVTEEMVEEDDDWNKQIVPAFIAEDDDEVCVDEVSQKAVTRKGMYRRTKSETKKEIIRPVMEYRRTESAKVMAMERLSSEEFRLKVETFIMERKRGFVKESDVVSQGLISTPALVGAASSGSGSGSC